MILTEKELQLFSTLRLCQSYFQIIFTMKVLCSEPANRHCVSVELIQLNLGLN